MDKKVIKSLFYKPENAVFACSEDGNVLFTNKRGCKITFDVPFEKTFDKLLTLKDKKGKTLTFEKLKKFTLKDFPLKLNIKTISMLKFSADIYFYKTKKTDCEPQTYIVAFCNIDKAKLLNNIETKYQANIWINKISDTLAYIDLKGNIRFLNAYGYKKIKYSPEETIGNNFLKFVLPEYKEKIKERFLNSPKDQLSEKIEIGIKTKDNKKMYFEYNATPCMENNIFQGWLIVLRDIKEHKQNRDRIKKSEFIYNASLNLVRLKNPEKNICKFVAESMTKIVEDSLSIVATYSRKKSTAVWRDYAGSKEIINAFKKSLGQEPKGMHFENVKDAVDYALKNGKSSKIYSGLYKKILTGKGLKVTEKVKKDLKVKKIYIIPLIHAKRCLGLTALLTKKDITATQTETIEAFSDLATIFIEKLEAQKIQKKTY